LGAAITGVRVSRDIRTLSDFRSNAAAFIEQVRSTSEPIIVTQNGRSAAVLLGIETYESLIDEIELLRDVRTAERQTAAGETEPPERTESRLRAMLGR
jgi:prevent-host-death family protein